MSGKQTQLGDMTDLISYSYYSFLLLLEIKAFRAHWDSFMEICGPQRNVVTPVDLIKQHEEHYYYYSEFLNFVCLGQKLFFKVFK